MRAWDCGHMILPFAYVMFSLQLVLDTSRSLAVEVNCLVRIVPVISPWPGLVAGFESKAYLRSDT